MILIKTLIFIYLLVAIRVLIFGIGLAWQALTFPHIKNHKKTFLHIIRRMIYAIVFWPIDCAMIPLIFLKAYIFFEKESLFRLGVFYGSTKMF